MHDGVADPLDIALSSRIGRLLQAEMFTAFVDVETTPKEDLRDVIDVERVLLQEPLPASQCMHHAHLALGVRIRELADEPLNLI